MYKANLKKNPDMFIRRMRQVISKYMRIDESTVHRIINEYKLANTVISP